MSVFWGAAGAAAIAVALAARRLHRTGRPGAAWSIVALRGGLSILVLLLLLNPYRIHRAPDPARFELGLLADVSGSMGSRDCSGHRSRLEVVRSQGLGKLLSRLRRRYRIRAWTFGPRPEPYIPGVPVRIAPGKTAIGDSLAAILDDFSDQTLGGIILLSDGHNNAGRIPTEAAKLLRRRNVPLTCIGVGAARRAGDLAVRFLRHHFRGRKGEPLAMPIEVVNRTHRVAVVRATVEPRWGAPVSRDLTVEAGGAGRYTFRIQPAQAGFQAVAVRITPQSEDARPENNVDYAAVRVEAPEIFHILYLGSRLSWEYKFLRRVLGNDKQITLAAIIRTGKKKWLRIGFGDHAETVSRTRETTGFPRTAAFFSRYDALVMDSGVFEKLDEKQRRLIRDFVDRRAGGLLCFGPLSGLPADVRGMLPVRKVRTEIPRSQVQLPVLRELMFRDVPAATFAAPPGPFLAAGVPVDVIVEWKRGARPVILTPDGKNAILAAQAYGGGRVVCTGLETTWRWRILSAAGADLHAAYWRGLLAWLAGTSRKRLDSPIDGARVSTGAECVLSLDVLGRDFRPAGDARVTAVVRTPAGREHTLPLPLSDRTPGRYASWFLPEDPGEYTVRFHVRLPEELLDTEAHFLAARIDAEVADTEYRPDVLEDMARITRGRFVPYTRMAELDTPVIHPGTAVIETRRYYADLPWPLLLLVILPVAEWFLRRRIGLR